MQKAHARPVKIPGEMNKLEAKYSEYLDQCQLAGMISLWRYESEKLRLADKTWYLPDFKVILPDGLIEFHEVKGFWRDDARVKIKVAAEQFPEYIFKSCTFNKAQGWCFEEF